MPDDLTSQDDGRKEGAQKRATKIDCAIQQTSRDLDNTHIFLEQLRGPEESGRWYIEAVIKRLREQLFFLKRMRDEGGNH